MPAIAIEDGAEVTPRLRGAYLAIGNFDGVHRGHAALIARLRAGADAAGVPALALTFDPHPLALLRPGSEPVPLVETDRKLALLEAAGATDVGVFRTGPWLLGLTAREFFDRLIVGSFEAGGMVEGPTFGFGRDRGGDAATLAAWCAGAGIAFEVAQPIASDGRIISSTRVRAALAEGRVAEAARLLERPHRLRGTVVRGAGRGAGLGFPTANLDGSAVMLPADGVYAVRALVDGVSHPAACHIGPNATFDEHARTVEVHLIDFEGDLYGRTLEVDLVDHLRGTRRFEGLPALLDQIAADVEQARAILRS